MNKRSILEFLEETALRYPEREAMRGSGRTLSFAALERRARSVGTALLEKGIYKGAVAVISGKHPDTVCAFLGALYAGCFYVCIDPDEPHERMLRIADACRADAVIYERESRDKAHCLCGRAELFCYEEICGIGINAEALSLVRSRATDSDLAYIVFTSGSTGEPKGVCTPHRAVIDYADALVSTLGFDSDTVFGNQAPLYYDAPMKELLPMLALGAAVCFIPKELFKYPAELCRYISEQGINTLCFTSSALASISALGALSLCDMSFLRTVTFGSEPFPKREYERWREHCPRTRFINLYGPTEATGMSAYWIADRELCEDEAIPIGRAFPNTEIFLLNESGEICLEGEVGEICIRGTCLSSGYLNGAESGRARFADTRSGKVYPESYYRTGDMGMVNAHGELVCLGRIDRQIKLMGRRIEPAEIEACAMECRGVLLASVTYDRERGRMWLFYTGDADERELSRLLSQKLPHYMLPRIYVRVESMPQGPNGKLDTKRLYELMTDR